jgi:hypothetical protein
LLTNLFHNLVCISVILETDTREFVKGLATEFFCPLIADRLLRSASPCP